MDDINYVRLAQYKAFTYEHKVDMETYDCIEEIFKLDSNINYQIPALDFIKLENPEIIGFTALHLALTDSKTGSFEKLLNHGADFTIKSSKGTTVLHEAIERSLILKGRLKNPKASLVLSAHVKHNNLSNPCDNNGMSHFHIACMLNNIEGVKFFLDGGVSPNKAINITSTKLSGYAPLHIAARYCSFETAQLLLKYGADKYSLDAKSMTPLHLLLERRMEIMDHMHMDKRAAFDHFKDELDMNECIVKLFIHNGNNQAYPGLSTFQAASTLQDTSLIEKLLEQHVDLNHTVSKDSPMWSGYTALHFSSHCNFKIVELLLSRGANMFAKDAKGVMPFDLCLERYEAQDIHVLLTAAMIQLNLDDIKFSDGMTKLTDLVGAMKSIYALTVFLAEEVKDINVYLPHDSPLWPGYTPLHLAVVFHERIVFGINDLYETCDYVKEECSKNYYNCEEFEDTLYEERIVLLLQFGADVTIQNVLGSTPIHLAFPTKSEKIFDWLLSNHTKILNPVDKNGLSHLHIACATRHQPFVERTLATFSHNIDDQMTCSFKYQVIDEDAYENKIRRFSVNPGSTFIHVAVAACDFTILRTLFRYNANLYVMDSFGMTPIHLILKSTELVHQTQGFLTHTEYWRFSDLLSLMGNLTECITDFGLSHLHVASYINHGTAIEKLLDAGASIDTRINLGDDKNESLAFLASYDTYTPLQIAIRKKNEKASEILAQRGADFSNIGADLLRKMLKRESPCRDIFVQNVKAEDSLRKRLLDNYGLTTLHIACITSDLHLVKESFRNGADPNALTKSNFGKWSGYTPLHLSVIPSNESGNQIEIIELLMTHGADITLTNPEGNTPVQDLFQDIYYEETDYFEPMLKNPKDCIFNPTNSKGVSHFHAACLTDNASIVEEFLKHGVDVNLKIDYFPWGYGGYTPLHLALQHNYEETIDLLLKYGSDVNARDRLGTTPFHTAAKDSMNFENLFDKLVNAGADVHARTLLGATALEKLTEIPSNWEQIKLLEKHGYRVNSFNPFTQEGLIGLSISQDNEDLSENPFYEAIIDADDSSDVDEGGRTPLHNIVSCHGFKKSTDAIEGFLKIGYDIDHQDKQGRTALHCAVSFFNVRGITALLEYGADINITDHNDKTAFMCFLDRLTLKKNNWERKSGLAICMIFAKHICKLQLLDFHVNVLDTYACSKTIEKNNLEEQFLLDCQEELEKTKGKIIDSMPITLFDILSSETRVIAAYPTMALQQRQTLDAIFETDTNGLRQIFPRLHCLFRLQYRKALARFDLLESAKYSLNTHIGFNMPDLCSNIIFVFLSNQDLKNLIFSTDDYHQPTKRRKLD